VLSRKNASYRLGAPLDVRWLGKGMTSHFEYREGDMRIRTDFCSRPPRVADISLLWKQAIRKSDISVIDVESLIRVTQTRRRRDYVIIGALAEEIGLNGNLPELALKYLQDYASLEKAVRLWPDTAAQCTRPAVQRLAHAPRGRKGSPWHKSHNNQTCS